MQQLILLLLLSLSIGVNGESPSPQFTRSSRYPQFYYSTRLGANHSDASTVCRRNAYRLVSITSDVIHQQVVYVIKYELLEPAWSSGKIVDHQWRWSTNETIDDRSGKWGGTDDQTNKQSIMCLLLQHPSDRLSEISYWKAEKCNSEERYICEDLCYNRCASGEACTPTDTSPYFTCSSSQSTLSRAAIRSRRDLKSRTACRSNPCPGARATCTRSKVSPYYSCGCQPTFFGQNCTQRYCHDWNPCQHGSNCLPPKYSSHGYRCQCINEYIGIHCEQDACINSPCWNGGTCTHSNIPHLDRRRFTCACVLPYFGKHCHFKHCIDVQPCQNGGECTRTTSQPGYQCTCVNGYSGYNCTTVPLYSNGSPVTTMMTTTTTTTFSQSTEATTTATTQETVTTTLSPEQRKVETKLARYACKPSPCGKYGSCRKIARRPYYKCSCHFIVDTNTPSHHGKHCEYSICRKPDPCLHGGRCYVWDRGYDSERYNCNCADGYRGLTCEIDGCHGNTCDHGGTCVHSGPRILGHSHSERHFTCACPFPYFGFKCRAKHCIDSEPCENGGVCTRTTSEPGYNCTCVNGYSGYNCTNGSSVTTMMTTETSGQYTEATTTQEKMTTASLTQTTTPKATTTTPKATTIQETVTTGSTVEANVGETKATTKWIIGGMWGFAVIIIFVMIFVVRKRHTHADSNTLEMQVQPETRKETTSINPTNSPIETSAGVKHETIAASTSLNEDKKATIKVKNGLEIDDHLD